LTAILLIPSASFQNRILEPHVAAIMNERFSSVPLADAQSSTFYDNANGSQRFLCFSGGSADATHSIL
jgi:hypothetical protein